ncbi:DNA-directed DNA polymerase [Sulfolobus tengchongensis]|uniref:DNA-directed DNA polymerase n=1 Tax=Sulfolobus tengchongensis TaxID=207809 RepID=A0AAX4KY96_9CREN
MIKNFFILDFSYEIKDDKPIVYIWGIDEEGNRCVVLEKNFRPYFYVTYEGNENEIIENIRKIGLISINKVQKRYLNNVVNALMLQTLIPSQIRGYRKIIAQINGVKGIFDADIRFTMRYSIDMNLRHFTWFTAEVSEVKSGDMRTPKVYELNKIISRYEGKIPELKILAIDIQIYNKYGSPNPRKDPIILISLWGRDGSTQLSVDDAKDDLKLLRNFVSKVIEYDPDLIVGYNTNFFHWSYVLDRAKTLGIKLDIGRKIGTEVSQGTYGHYSIVGRLNVDLADLIADILGTENKDLIDVADYLNIIPKSKRTILNWYEISKYWDDIKNRELVKQYSLDNAKSIYLLSNSLLPLYEELVKIIGLPLDQLSSASWGSRIESLVIREAIQLGELVPTKVENVNVSKDSLKKSDLLIEPKIGIHKEHVYVLDVTSVYPSVIRKFNIGPDALIKDLCENCYLSPDSSYKFRKEPPSFYKLILDKLDNVMRITEEKLKKGDIGESLGELENKLRAIKMILNNFNDYINFVNSRWYSKEISEAVEEWGKHTIRTLINLIGNSGFEIIYADNRSIFVKGSNDKLVELVNRLNSLYGLEIEVQKIYKTLLIIDKFGRFVGLTDKNKIDIVGLQRNNKNLCELTKDLQRKIVETILIDGDVTKAIKLVRATMIRLRRGEYSIEELVTWRYIDTDLATSKTTAPHIVAAKKAISANYPVSVGSKIGFVIVKGAGRVADRAEPYFLIKEKNRIDIEYYINQILSESSRLLRSLGVDEEKLKKTSITDILDFFGSSKKK